MSRKTAAGLVLAVLLIAVFFVRMSGIFPMATH